MQPDKLAYMANQIASFFRSYPDDEAAAGIQDHIAAFWTRKMRDGLDAHAAAGGAGLDPLVRRAVLLTQTGPSPIDKETAGPARVGALGSDAG